MPTTTRVPANIDATAWFTRPTGALVGGDDALVTSDGDTSYVELIQDGYMLAGSDQAHTFTFEPVGAIPADAVVTVEVDWYTTTNAVGDSGGFALFFDAPGLGVRTIQAFTVPGEGGHPYGSPDTATVAAAWVADGRPFQAGARWAVVALSAGATTVATMSRITRLTMLIETTGTPHLRQRNRDTIRARNLASRQRGIRARGYL